VERMEQHAAESAKLPPAVVTTPDAPQS
jgi:hypothetical protein